MLIVHSVYVIAVCTALFGYFVWLFFSSWHPVLGLTAPLMLCVPPLIAAMQYRAVFGRSENAARKAGKYVFLTGGLFAILFAALTYLYATSEKPDPYRVACIACITIAFAYLLYCGKATQRWADELQEVDRENAPRTED
jgi:O-antigen/teichoic acid export membrane protein